jgi:hypothetical protein
LNLKSPGLWLSLMSLSAVLLVAVVDMERKAPGPVASVHARVAKLDGGNACAQCHGGWFSNMTDACMECHAPIQEQIAAGTGLHGILGKAKAEACAPCHSEHHGAGFAIVNLQSFRQAGVRDPDAFEHDLIGFAMAGKHLELTCTECHEHARDPVLAEGTQRFMGLDQDCASCHEDVHAGRFALSCTACHGQESWQELHSEGHEKILPLVGGHGDQSCRACHSEEGAHSLEIVGALAEPATARTCAECHASPHDASFSDGVAALVQMQVETSCVVCHVAEHTSFREETLVLSAEQHARSGFPLAAPHDAPTCAQCHPQEEQDFARRYPGRSAEACSACHADPHGGQFAVGLFAGEQCSACHAPLHFEPHDFTLAKHAETAFALDGKHVETECNACHALPSPEAPRQFHGTPGRCEECHADAHTGFFAELAQALPVEPRGDCARCHSTQDFSAVPEKQFDHARWARFPIVGAHAQSECASCHPATAEPDATGRTFGRVDASFGDFEGCATCHRDPHQGGFDFDDLPVQVNGRIGCARCHIESSFRSFPGGFDHARWTGFHLLGGHAQADCSECHAPRRPADANGRTWEPALGATCNDCHMDPHGGQFEVEGVIDCARCHTDARADFMDFNHDRDSSFKLGEQHRALACSACHLATQFADGSELIRYRPLAGECVDCHGVQEDVLLRRNRRKN